MHLASEGLGLVSLFKANSVAITEEVKRRADVANKTIKFDRVIGGPVVNVYHG